MKTETCIMCLHRFFLILRLSCFSGKNRSRKQETEGKYWYITAYSYYSSLILVIDKGIPGLRAKRESGFIECFSSLTTLDYKPPLKIHSYCSLLFTLKLEACLHAHHCAPLQNDSVNLPKFSTYANMVVVLA